MVISFNPLKAGRKRDFVFRRVKDPAISIPSRRVGNKNHRGDDGDLRRISIPSRRVGNARESEHTTYVALISIPSRRVGNQPKRLGDAVNLNFNPLKAGRKHSERANPNPTLG